MRSAAITSQSPQRPSSVGRRSGVASASVSASVERFHQGHDGQPGQVDAPGACEVEQPVERPLEAVDSQHRGGCRTRLAPRRLLPDLQARGRPGRMPVVPPRPSAHVVLGLQIEPQGRPVGPDALEGPPRGPVRRPEAQLQPVLSH